MKRWLAPDRAWLLGIFLLAVLTFAPALRNNYTLDDVALVQKFPLPHGLSAWVRACLAPWWPNHPYFHHWRPVSRTSVLLQKAIVGQTAWPFYAFNLLLHAAIALLVYRLGRRLGLCRTATGIGALWFAAQPMHAETVHQIIVRCDLLVAFFMLAGLAALPRGALRGARVWLVQPLVYFLALGSKDNGVLYPAMVFLMICAGCAGADDALPAEPHAAARRERWGWFFIPWRQGRLWALMALFTAVLGVFLMAKHAMAGGVLVDQMDYYENPLGFMSFWQRLPSVLGLLGYAASRVVWPLGLAPDYTAISFPFSLGWGWGWSWAGLALLAATLGLMARNARRGGRGWVLAAAALILYSLVSNGPIKIGGAVAQRFWYLPSVPVCLGLGWALERFYRRLRGARRRAAALALAGVLAAFVAVAWRDAAGWRSPDDFYRATLARFPQNRRGLIAMAYKGFTTRDFKSGYACASQVVALFPGDEDGWGYRGGCAMFLPGLQQEAEADMLRALALDRRPDCWVRINYAQLLEKEGRKAEAAKQLEIYLATPAAADREAVARKLKTLQGGK